MKKFLWDLDIEEIPLGWLDTYNKALIQSPNGIPHVINGQKFHVDPVKCRDLLVQVFNKHKELSSELNRIKSKTPNDISRLLKSDIILFNVLFTWLLDGDIVGFDFFDYKKYQNESSFLECETYFKEEIDKYSFLEPITHYYPYKYLSLNE